jgi:hypothetical protein
LQNIVHTRVETKVYMHHTSIVLLMMLATTIVLVSAAYALWSQQLRIEGVINIGKIDSRITSSKIVCDKCEASLLVDTDDPLAVHLHVESLKGSENTLWIGLVVSNEGNIPIKITSISTGVDSKAYSYGPFRSVGNSGVWGHVVIDMLPFPNYHELPSVVDNPSYKLILWIKLDNVQQKHDYDIKLVAKPFNS